MNNLQGVILIRNGLLITLFILLFLNVESFGQKKYNKAEVLELIENKQKFSYLDEKDIGYYPKNGFIPNDTVAILIAKTVLHSIYGDRIFDKSYKCELLNDSVWYVNGVIKQGYLGGAPHVWIHKKSGEILKLYHTK